ncbi:MAG: trypsin-like peptidase domain-containing protein [Planctomycetaceae bacterium]|jgi:serine protease Do|nr:trypsin-like peptidase domain-containing protein [Planctomycetaceae bacterium]
MMRRKTTTILFLLIVGTFTCSLGFAATPESLSLPQIQEKLYQTSQKALKSVVGLRVNRMVIGSGVVVSEDGLVLTAGHVTGEAGLDVEFMFPDGRRVRGKTLGVCQSADAAMAQITETGKWSYSPMAKKETFAVNDWVFAFGHPLGLITNRPPPLRFGRIIQLQPDTVHTDCSIVVGDSGGPLFNLNGEVIGIHSRISGINDKPDLTFHVSINVFHDYYDRLRNGEVWEYDSNGRYDSQLNSQLENAVREILPMTVRVQSETLQSQGNQRRSSARQQREQRVLYRDHALGLIVSADGFIVTKASEIADRKNIQCVLNVAGREERVSASIVGTDRQNDLTLLKIEKKGLPAADLESAAKTSANIPIGTLIITPIPNPEQTKQSPTSQTPAHSAILGAVSISVRSIPSEILSLGVTLASNDSVKGARVLQILGRSPAAVAGVRQNDVVTHIDDKPLENYTEFMDTVHASEEGKTLNLTVQRGGKSFHVTVTIGSEKEYAERRNAMNQGGPLGISRVRDGFPKIIQHDSVLRPFDCGGPLVTLDGNIIGINIARAGRTETYAVPLEQVRQIVEKLRDTKK